MSEVDASMPQHKTEDREIRKRKKELAEARQSGKAAPEIDVESGKMINPHNPEYITKRPWYLGESGPSLNHHAVQKKDHFISLHEADKVAQERKKRMSKSAALQVGMWVEALKHGKTPWLQAKVTKLNMDGTADLEFEDGKIQSKVKREHVKTSLVFGSMVGIEQEGKLAFDAKRDRWHGYDPSAHKLTIDKYNRMDDERRKRRQAAKDEKYRRKEEEKNAKEDKLKKKSLAKLAREENGKVSGGGRGGGGGGGTGSGGESDVDSGTDSLNGKSDASDSDSDYDSDSDAEFDDDEADEREFIMRDADAQDFQRRVARQGGIGGAEMKTTVRNLRIREDTAKYLRNLDPNSAFYDPKTRSMRDNPLPNENPEEIPFAGDNFQRISGDAVELARTTVFAWEATEKSGGATMVDSIANPSQVEFARKEYEKKKSKLETDKKRSVFDKYGTGGAENMDAGHAERRLALGTSEAYVEYARDGRVVRGAAKAVAKSKYPEDILLNNHTKVWGSWFDKRLFRWGFGDDHSLEKNSYSTGEAGRKANEDAAAGITTGVIKGNGVGEGGEGARKMLEVKSKEDREAAAAARDKNSKVVNRSDLYGEQLAPNLDQDKLKEALKKEDEFRKRAAAAEEEEEELSKSGVKKKKSKKEYNSMTSFEVTPEEMEAYRMRKTDNMNDPMMKFKDSEEILEYDAEKEEAKGKKKR